MDRLKSNTLKRVRRSDKPAQSKKKKCEGTACSTFFAGLTKKFKMKKKEKEESNDIDLKANCNDTLSVEDTKPLELNNFEQADPTQNNVQLKTTLEHNISNDQRTIIKDYEANLKQPREITTKMNVLKSITPIFVNQEMVKNSSMQTDKSVKNIQTSSILFSKDGPIEQMPAKMEPNITGMKEQDIAGELTKHVATLRKISLIAEEFNKKTAKNLKEIIDSVSEDLVKKLEEVKAEQAQSPKPDKKVSIDSKNGITIN